jgi:hypothetical protein
MLSINNKSKAKLHDLAPGRLLAELDRLPSPTLGAYSILVERNINDNVQGDVRVIAATNHDLEAVIAEVCSGAALASDHARFF